MDEYLTTERGKEFFRITNKLSNSTLETINVLLIEDNPDTIILIQEMLAEDNYNKFILKCAGELSTGLKYLNEEKNIDVVLLDLSLPDSQGIDTITKVLNFTSEIPIVVLTNYDNEMFAIKALQKGVQDYLIKGLIDNNVLVRAIRYSIERDRLRRELEKKLEEVRKLGSR
jgi:DNA-binding NarL/FixJ family response regulator